MRWGAAYYVRIDFEGDVANELDLFKAVFEHLNSINLEAHGGTVPSMHITELESHRLIDGRPGTGRPVLRTAAGPRSRD